jgi:predicted PurR-regulated permease PerM
MRKNPRQFSLAELLAWTTIVAVWLSAMKCAGENWSFILAFGAWIIAPYLDRRFSLRFSATAVVAIVFLLVVVLALFVPVVEWW